MNYSRNVKDQIWSEEMTNSRFKNVKRSVFKELYQNNQFLGNGVPLVIRLLQCYEILWTHDMTVLFISFITYILINIKNSNI